MEQYKIIEKHKNDTDIMTRNHNKTKYKLAILSTRIEFTGDDQDYSVYPRISKCFTKESLESLL